MRFSRGQNPSRGDEPEPQETPDSATPETGSRGGERASWFAPLPPEPLPSEQPQDASGAANRGTSSDRPRTPLPPVADSFDPDDLYPPEYRPGGAREASRAPTARDAYGQGRGQGREPAAPRNDDRGGANRDAHERSMRPRTTTTGNQRSNARSGGRDTPPSPPISEQFGWQTPEWERNRTPPAPPRPPPLSAHWEEREERIRQEESGELPRISPPGAGAYNPSASGVRPATPPTDDPAAFTNDGGAYSPYSQQFTLPPYESPEGTSGQTTYSPSPDAFPAPFPGQGEHERAYRPNSFAPGGETRSEPVYNNGAPAAPFSLTHSGRLATTGRPGTSDAFTAVSGAPPFAAPSRGTRTTDMPVRGLVTDPVVWSFLGLAFVLTAAMVAFVMLRYDSFPQQITLHFGPAGASQRDRIGERRELWTIPFLSVIVFLANTALAFVFDFFDRHDRFVPRLLAIGSALVSAVAWVVLLTLLYR